MTESTGAAVAKRDADIETGIGTLPENVRVALELRKRAGMVAAQIANMSWGQKLDLATRRAVAEYGRRFGVDVVTEIHVLGNNIYLNAAYWLRRLSELADQGLVEYAYADHVEDDPRLKALGDRGEDEQKRRAWERITHGIPDRATGAVVFHVKLKSMTQDVIAARWCGGGTRKNDPVGEAEPIVTAETRAARRCIRMIASHKPGLFGEMDEMDHVEEQLQGVIRGSRQVWAEREAKLAPMDRAALVPGGDDPYSDTEPTVGESFGGGEPMEVQGPDDEQESVGDSLFPEDAGTRPKRGRMED